MADIEKVTSQLTTFLPENPEGLAWSPGAASRLVEVVDKLLLLFKVGPLERNVAQGMLKLFAKGATDDDIVKAISLIQTEIIPFILTGEVNG